MSAQVLDLTDKIQSRKEQDHREGYLIDLVKQLEALELESEESGDKWLLAFQSDDTQAEDKQNRISEEITVRSKEIRTLINLYLKDQGY